MPVLSSHMVRANEQARMPAHPQYVGARLGAEEFGSLPDDGFRYQLINGVVVMSPSPELPHQFISLEIAGQIRDYLKKHAIGRITADTDVVFDGLTVYRPVIAFFLNGRLGRHDRVPKVAPDFVIEIVSPSSGRLDRRTKRADYERFGVREYWIVDAETISVEVLRPKDDRFEAIPTGKDRIPSAVLPGFELDLVEVRKASSI
ncbi:MAG: Uma2 family endonuclease [Vicinamibacterales bacterium]